MAIAERYDSLELVQDTPTGRLFRARHRALGRTVQLRQVDTNAFDDETLAAVRSAITRTAQLVHPNILSVTDAEFGTGPGDESGDEFYYVSDHVVDSLQDRIAAAPFDVDTVARWGLQLLRGLTHAHEHGVCLGGVSPWRVHFDQVGTVRLADFGLTSAVRDGSSGMVTFEADATGYLPLTAIRDPARIDEAADRYGVAMLIGQLLTGTLPESTSIDRERALGRVPSAIATSLGVLLGGNATIDDARSAIAAFKEWVDSLRPADSTSVSAAPSDVVEPDQLDAELDAEPIREAEFRGAPAAESAPDPESLLEELVPVEDEPLDSVPEGVAAEAPGAPEESDAVEASDAAPAEDEAAVPTEHAAEADAPVVADHGDDDVSVEEAEPVEAEPVKAEPVKAEPVEAEPEEAEPVEAEPVEAEVAAAAPVTGSAQADRVQEKLDRYAALFSD